MSQDDREKHTSIEVPLTPRSPMRSALKVPGTPGRFIDPRSPTFKEEKALEVQEEKTEKQNAKDMVGFLLKERRREISSVPAALTKCTESQDSCEDSQVVPSRCQFQLQSYRPIHALNHLHHLQRN